MSTVHIKINFALQVVGILLLVLSYFVASLVHFNPPDNPDVDSWITAWRIKAPTGAKYWYWKYKFDDEVNCRETGFPQDSDICRACYRSWLINTLLNASLIFGMILTGFSLTWTYFQLDGYYHKKNVSHSNKYLAHLPNIVAV